MKAKTNIKVMTKPELTDEEIRSHMDFDKLLQGYHKSNLAPNAPKWFLISSISIAIVAAVSTVFYFSNNFSNQSVVVPSQPVVTVDTVSRIKENKVSQMEVKKNEEKKETDAVRKAPTIPKEEATNDSLKTEKLAPSQFTEAMPVDGYPSLHAYFDRELKYPTAPKDSTEGVVTVTFAITTSGKPDRIKIENSLGAAFDAECIRVIKNMPAWRAATVNGKPVQVNLSVPLSFKIKK